MAVRRLSIALDDDVAAAVGDAADRAGVSVSAWLNEAAAHELKLEEDLALVNAELTGAELAAAADLLDRLLDRATSPAR